jgi:hypothetical protein
MLTARRRRPALLRSALQCRISIDFLRSSME